MIGDAESIVQVYENVSRPYGIVMAPRKADSSTVLVAAENGDHCVSYLSKDRTLRVGQPRRASTGKTVSRLFHFPRGVAISKDNQTLVTDNHQLKKVNDSGRSVKCIGDRRPGKGSFNFDCPSGIAVDRNTGTIFVADCENHRVQAYSENFDFLHSIVGPCKKFLNHPVALAIDNSNQYLYVVEWMSQVKQMSLVDGHCVLTIGSPTQGSCFGSLNHPTGIAIDSEHNRVFVTERGNHRVSVFDTRINHCFVSCFGEKGKSRGQFDGPYGIATHRDRLYVSDYYNDRIIVYESGQI